MTLNGICPSSFSGNLTTPPCTSTISNIFTHSATNPKISVIAKWRPGQSTDPPPKARNAALGTDLGSVSATRFSLFMFVLLSSSEVIEVIEVVGLVVYGFQAHFDRTANAVEQGRVIAMVLEGLMLRRTYQSSCVTHPNGDIHSLHDLMPPSIPIRIHVENNSVADQIWTQESRQAYHHLHHKDKNASSRNKDKLLINGKYKRLLTAGSFYAPLFLATEIHDIQDNPVIVKYHELHDKNHYAAYLYRILENIFEVAQQRNYKHVFPFYDPDGDKQRCRMPSRKKHSKIVARAREKVIIWCMNPTEQEILNCILNLCGVRSVALLARYNTADKADILRQFKTPIAETVSRAISASQRDQEIKYLLISDNHSTGLNLQHCHRIIFTGPAPSDTIYCQCCGRIIRISQEHACVIVETYDHKSYKFRVFAKNIQHTLPALVASINMNQLQHLFSANTDDEASPEGADAISPEGLQGYLMFPDSSILHHTTPSLQHGTHDGVELEPLKFVHKLFAMTNIQSYKAKRDEDNAVSVRKTAHASEVTVSSSNTPSKFPCLRGDRAHEASDLRTTLKDLNREDREEEMGLTNIRLSLTTRLQGARTKRKIEGDAAGGATGKRAKMIDDPASNQPGAFMKHVTLNSLQQALDAVLERKKLDNEDQAK
ncbi:Nn.00g006860.m01.CDS01 [Neocucurbitaria sp. VM-36]